MVRDQRRWIGQQGGLVDATARRAVVNGGTKACRTRNQEGERYTLLTEGVRQNRPAIWSLSKDWSAVLAELTDLLLNGAADFSNCEQALTQLRRRAAIARWFWATATTGESLHQRSPDMAHPHRSFRALKQRPVEAKPEVVDNGETSRRGVVHPQRRAWSGGRRSVFNRIDRHSAPTGN